MNADTLLLEPDEHIPEVTLSAVPWVVHGSGYVVLVRAGALTDQQLFVAPSLRGKRHGEIISLLVFDYTSTPCGPYREMLVAAVFDFAEGHYSSVTRAFTSTYAGVVNSRQHWGVPKDRADIAVERLSDKRDRVAVSREGHVIAELDLEQSGFSIPVTTAVLPAELRTMVQHWRGKQYSLVLNAKGKTRLAKLRTARFDPRFFPDVSKSSVIAAAYLPSFELTLPAAAMRDI
jgi:hypothetical protein